MAETANEWGVSERWVRMLINEGRVPGATREGRRWLIPLGSPRPTDERAYRHLNVPEELRSGFAAVDALRDALAEHRPPTQGELERLREEFTIEYTYDSNAIEGSSLSLRETALILDGVTIGGKPLKEHLEVVGHRDAFSYVEQLATERPPAPITVRTIKQIHHLVLADKPEDRGAFRSLPVRIGGSTHLPPDPSIVPELVDALVAGLQDNKLHPLHQATRFHLEFESIHPFIDGNGRTGRLLLNLMLMQQGYLPINIKYTDRKRYLDCLEAWDLGQDDEPMTKLVTNYAQQRLEDWLTALRISEHIQRSRSSLP